MNELTMVEKELKLIMFYSVPALQMSPYSRHYQVSGSDLSSRCCAVTVYQNEMNFNFNYSAAISS